MTPKTIRYVAFRVDASLDIGAGHVMRCLTLADAFKEKGACCKFVCRAWPGNLLDLIAHRGHEAVALPAAEQPIQGMSLERHSSGIAHAAWLGADWRTDAAQTAVALRGELVDWLVVDHYAIDYHWETALQGQYRKLMIIDDLADREHVCDVLLDQNLVEDMDRRYLGKTPENCIRLIGPQHALLRPEFELLRPASLARRKTLSLDRLLIFMSGGDPQNETGKAVAGVTQSKRRWRRVDIVVGRSFPAMRAIMAGLEKLPCASLHVQTSEMAKFMAAADLALTAGGSVTWEKCALGLPSFVAIMAENQRAIAGMMNERGAQRTVGFASDIVPASYAQCLDEIEPSELASMIEHASATCDGSGVKSVVKTLECHL
jgi:UDP-2,4-diacetamido-2,4,6-trideoxy-beta-L-altropyranose hydrolase